MGMVKQQAAMHKHVQHTICSRWACLVGNCGGRALITRLLTLARLLCSATGWRCGRPCLSTAGHTLLCTARLAAGKELLHLPLHVWSGVGGLLCWSRHIHQPAAAGLAARWE